MKSILDPSFHYVPAAKTDLRKTFARVRREIARAKAPVIACATDDGLARHACPTAAQVADMTPARVRRIK